MSYEIRGSPVQHADPGDPRNMNAERRDIEGFVRRLTLVDYLRRIGLPLVAAAAGISAFAEWSAPFAFAAVSGILAVAVIILEFLARKERSHLVERLNDLASRQILDASEIDKIIATANTVTVAGSSRVGGSLE